MLSDFFEARWRIRALRQGPSGASLEGFADALSDLRYATITGRKHLRSAEHFIDWAGRNGLAVPGVNTEALDRFARHVARCRCRYAHANRIEVLKGARIFDGTVLERHVISQ